MTLFSFLFSTTINSENKQISISKPLVSTYDKALQVFASWCDVLLGSKGGQCHPWGAWGGGRKGAGGARL